jgi:hypothetical protein
MNINIYIYSGREALTVNIFVDVLDGFNAARRLDIEVAFIFPQQVRVVRDYPAAVDIVVELIVALYSLEHRAVLRTTVRKALAAFATRFRVRIHAWALWIQRPAWSVDHVLAYEVMQFSINGFIRNLARHNFVHILSSARFVVVMFHDQ